MEPFTVRVKLEKYVSAKVGFLHFAVYFQKQKTILPAFTCTFTLKHFSARLHVNLYVKVYGCKPLRVKARACK